MTTVAVTRTIRNMPALGYGDYLRFNHLVQDRCGLYFPDSRRSGFEQGVLRAFAASPCVDLNTYYRLLLDADKGDAYFDQLVNALTTNETYFFRDAGQFDALYKHVLPQIIARRRSMRSLRIWSVGCASGEEPYSIAMLLRELIPDIDEWSITILGSDINTEVLDRARKAVYSDWAFREPHAKTLQPRYFHKQDKRYVLAPAVRRMVTFAQLNLAQDDYPAYTTNTTLMDLILCRNVMIYFNSAFANEIIERFYNALVEGGWLVVGHSEHALAPYRRFQTHNFPNAVLYQSVDHPNLQSKNWDVFQAFTPPAPVPALPEEDIRVDSVSPLPVLPADIMPAIQESIPEDDSLERAQELLDYGHSAQARDILLKITDQQPAYAAAYSSLGRAFANMGYWAKAEHWCRQAVRFDKLALEAYYTLALVLEHQGQLTEAIDVMKKVVYIDRNYVLGHFSLANLYHNNGQLSPALKALNNIRRLLTTRTQGEIVAGSGGITVGSLQETIVRQEQQWSAEQHLAEPAARRG